MRAHASWGSLNDVMLVFMNQDAYDKFRLSKEDYELQKNWKRTKEHNRNQENGKRKVITKKIRREERGKVKDIVVELNNIEDRIVRLTPNSSDLGSAIITKDGETLYYLSAFEGGYDLWKMNLRKKDTKLLHKMDAGWANMGMDKDGKNLFLLGSNTMQKMGTNSESLKPISYQAHVKMDLAAERDYMFNHVYKQEQNASTT